MRLVNSDISIGCATGIRVGNGDPAKASATDYVWLLIGRQVRLPQRIELRRVAVRPTVDGNSGNVARRIEATAGQCAAELLADLALEGLKWCGQKLGPPGAVLIGGGLCVVAPFAMPTGWYVIGRTPERLYAAERKDAFLIQAGDNLRFDPIDVATFRDLEQRATSGEIVARKSAA